MKDRAFSVGTTSIAYRPAIEAVPTRYTPSLVVDQIIDDTLAYFIQQGVLFDVILDNVENRSLAGIGSILKPERGAPCAGRNVRAAACCASGPHTGVYSFPHQLFLCQSLPGRLIHAEWPQSGFLRPIPPVEGS